MCHTIEVLHHFFFRAVTSSWELKTRPSQKTKLILTWGKKKKNYRLTRYTNKPEARNETTQTKKIAHFSDDFGLRSAVVQKPLQLRRKVSATSIVARVPDHRGMGTQGSRRLKRTARTSFGSDPHDMYQGYVFRPNLRVHGYARI